MTKEEFDNWKFDKNQTVLYNGDFYPIFFVDFDAYLIAFKINGKEKWMNCEDLTIIPF